MYRMLWCLLHLCTNSMSTPKLFSSFNTHKNEPKVHSTFIAKMTHHSDMHSNCFRRTQFLYANFVVLIIFKYNDNWTICVRCGRVGECECVCRSCAMHLYGFFNIWCGQMMANNEMKMGKYATYDNYIYRK